MVNTYYSAWIIHRRALFLSITSSFYYYFKANPNAVSSPFPVLLCFCEFYRTLLSLAHAILPYQGTSLKIKRVSHCRLFGGWWLGLVGRGWLVVFSSRRDGTCAYSGIVVCHSVLVSFLIKKKSVLFLILKLFSYAS